MAGFKFDLFVPRKLMKFIMKNSGNTMFWNVAMVGSLSLQKWLYPQEFPQSSSLIIQVNPPDSQILPGQSACKEPSPIIWSLGAVNICFRWRMWLDS